MLLGLVLDCTFEYFLNGIWLSSSFLFLLLLSLVQLVGFLYPSRCLGLPLLHHLPLVPALAIRLDDRFLALSLLLNLCEVPLQVVQLVCDALELALGIAFGLVELEHFFVVGVEGVNELCLVCALLLPQFVLQLCSFVPEFLQLSFLSVDLSLELFFPGAVIFKQSIMQLFVFLANALYLLLLVVLCLPDLTLELINLLLFLLSVLCSILPQLQQV